MPEEQRRLLLGPAGALRRLGLLSETLSPGPGVADWLAGAAEAAPVPLCDPTLIAVDPTETDPLDPAIEPVLAWLARGAGGTLGIWGSRAEDTAAALAAALGRPLLRFAVPGDSTETAARLTAELVAAAALGAVFWLPAETLVAAPPPLVEACAHTLARRRQLVFMTGATPWRPVPLFADGRYREVHTTPAAADPEAWRRAAPGLSAEAARDLAGRFRFGLLERRTAAALARAGSNSAADTDAAMSRACALVAQPARCELTRIIEPRRGPADLVLAEPLHSQVLEIARFYQAADAVDHGWRLGHLSGTAGSIKVLLSGDPGTGKTLAAEVVAGLLGLPLIKADLAQVVSKWIGETEKNLDAVFRHAEDSHAVLFFDEADTLFGKRGEVRHATDRYANLEVGYLLQRLEAFRGGLAIVATNLREELDPAFTRRFQLSLHFPRPGRAERLRLWRLAFASASLAPEISAEALAGIDLTGAGIVSSARLAALIARAEDSAEIGVRHVQEAIGRQFRNEARLTPPALFANGAAGPAGPARPM